MRGKLPSFLTGIGAVLPLAPVGVVVARLAANATAERPASLALLPLPGPLSDGYLRGDPGFRRLEEVD